MPLYSLRVTSRSLRAAAVAFVALSVAVASRPATASPTAKPAVTFVGDSVSESIDYVRSARRTLSRRFAVQFDLKVCRRLVAPSCAFQGSAPPTALQAVQAYGTRLGDVLVVDVGYNEDSRGYGRGIDQVMRAAHRDGATGVVWVTLRETRDIYRRTNTAIRSAAQRWPQLVVVDWNAYSAGRSSFFRGDGLHLTAQGAEALARLLVPNVARAARRP